MFLDRNMNFRFLIFLCLLQAQAVRGFGQQKDSLRQEVERMVFFEPTGEGTTRFFFDETYSLVDKDCQYVAIERIGTYSVAAKGFEGPFADYDLNGRLLLEGSYVQGKKQGDFTAYFPNGTVQWQVTFENDRAKGTWRFNYPDGLPLMEIRYEEEGTKLQSFWDDRGRQRVVDGNGRYEFAVQVQGYNERGYSFLKSKGKVKGGRPDGIWDISYLYSGGDEYAAGHEVFNNGQFRRGYDAWEERAYYLNPKIQISPSVYFMDAETMQAKDCSIDAHEGFTYFIAERLDKALSRYDFDRYGPVDVGARIEVLKDGQWKEIEVEKGYEQLEEVRDLLEKILATISYWIPSYRDENYIDDTLSLMFQVIPRTAPESGVFINNIRIKREHGY